MLSRCSTLPVVSGRSSTCNNRLSCLGRSSRRRRCYCRCCSESRRCWVVAIVAIVVDVGVIDVGCDIAVGGGVASGKSNEKDEAVQDDQLHWQTSHGDASRVQGRSFCCSGSSYAAVALSLFALPLLDPSLGPVRFLLFSLFIFGL